MFYKAIKTREFDIVDRVIASHAQGYEHVIVLGDFNENLLDPNPVLTTRMGEFRAVFERNDLHICYLSFRLITTSMDHLF